MNPLWKVTIVLLLVLGIAVPVSFFPTLSFFAAASPHQMARFNSYSELMNFIQSKPSVCPGTTTTSTVVQNPRTGPTGLLSVNSAGSTDYSGTNIQVQGVDELDTVKTDGQFIYTITNNTLVIVKASRINEASVVSRIDPNGTLTGVFVQGDHLVLIGGESGYGPLLMGNLRATGMVSSTMPVWYYRPTTRLWVYDISNRSSPVLTLTLQQSGGYEGSRLISSSLYLITTESLFIRDDGVTLPSKMVNGRNATVLPTEIYHSDVLDNYYSFTSIVRLDLAGPPKLTSETFLISASSTIYASTGNIYLTSTTWACDQETVIHRISISNGAVSYEATGAVPGTVKNQFSMDEYQGFFRVSTSTWQQRPMQAFPVAGTPIPSPLQGLTTNVYVLNSGLRIVGRVEGLAPGEQFHSARFFGDRGYLVTFKKTDPLFVLDLANPTAPRVLGELHVAGYSDYLQPYDETHLIGIGKNTTDAAAGSFAWYQGVKISLFDVSDPTNPVEVSNYVIGDRGTTSEALSDSHAVLFDHDRNLLVIPVEVAKLPDNNVEPWMWGSFVWQGAYVFSVSPETGLVFKGGITHLQNGEMPTWNSNRFITRSLYIGDVLYTISPAMVKMNSLTDLTELGSVAI